MKRDLGWALRTFGVVAALATAASAVPACVASDALSGEDEADGADAIKTKRIIARAQQWVDAKVPYCESANHVHDPDTACSSTCERPPNKRWDPYRSDCSGFVSWAWGIPPILSGGRTTRMFAPYQNDVSHAINAHKLRPGDAANKVTDDPTKGHIVLFESWIVEGKSALFMAEPGCNSKTPYAIEFTGHVDIHGQTMTIDELENDAYTAIRFDDSTLPGEPPADREQPTTPVSTPDGIDLAFQANTGALWTAGADGTKDWNLGMKAGTSPAIAVEDGHFQVAFQANTGSLWLARGDGHAEDLKLGMQNETTPAICALDGGGYQIAFQANTGNLWTTGTAGTHDTGQPMMAGTSPSIACLPGGGYEVAYQASSSSLVTTGSAGTRVWNLGMNTQSSPAIAGLSAGEYVVAFEANTNNLWVVDSKHGGGDQNLGMYAATNPSIVALADGGWQVAFEANTTALWTHGTAGTFNREYGMLAGTSPAIARGKGGGYDVAFQANTTALWVVAVDGTGGDQRLGMMPGTSPAVN
jgi:hypothetical protein